MTLKKLEKSTTHKRKEDISQLTPPDEIKQLLADPHPPVMAVAIELGKAGKRTRTKWVNVGTSSIEVQPGRMLDPGKDTNQKPMRLAFYKQIGALKEIVEDDD